MKNSKFILFLVNPFSGNGNGVEVANQAKLIVENNDKKRFLLVQIIVY